MWDDDAITIANPGDFRLPIEEARKPGASDPRNEAMLKIFSFVNVGERAGSGPPASGEKAPRIPGLEPRMGRKGTVNL